MIPALASITKDIAIAALDGLSLRHQAIASNIANRDTPGYERLTVSFEDKLTAISDAKGAGAPDYQLRALLDQVASGFKLEGSGSMEVRLDVEMSDLTRNTLQYQALITSLSRVGSITRAAISGGQ